MDAVRSRRDLVLENAVLRHRVNVMRRHSKRPKLHLAYAVDERIGPSCSTDDAPPADPRAPR